MRKGEFKRKLKKGNVKGSLNENPKKNVTGDLLKRI